MFNIPEEGTPELQKFQSRVRVMSQEEKLEFLKALLVGTVKTADQWMESMYDRWDQQLPSHAASRNEMEDAMVRMRFKPY